MISKHELVHDWLPRYTGMPIERFGNYVLLTDRTVDYFYSSSRDRFTFSWSNGSWVYTASSADLGVLDSLLIAFPY